MQLNSELLHDFHCCHSPEAKFPKPGRVDGNLSSSGTWRTYVHRRHNSSIIMMFSLLIGFFFSILVVAFSPTSVRIGNSFCMSLIKKATRLLSWVVQ